MPPAAAGELADLVAVSPSVFEIDPHALAETKVVLTMVGGRVVVDVLAEPGRPSVRSRIRIGSVADRPGAAS